MVIRAGFAPPPSFGLGSGDSRLVGQGGLDPHRFVHHRTVQPIDMFGNAFRLPLAARPHS